MSDSPDSTTEIPLDPSGFADPGRPRYCARCAAPLIEEERSGRLRPRCPRCGWVYYAKNALGAAVLIERAGQVLLVQRAHEPYQGDWKLPAGFVEYGEEAASSAVREAEEECALAVEVDGVFGTYFGTDDPRNPSYLLVYRAHTLDSQAEPTAGDDACAVRWSAPGHLPPNIAFAAHRRALADWQAGFLLPSAPPLGEEVAPSCA